MRLEGKVAIVTGAARGIGQAVVQRLAAEGAKVLAGDIDPMAGAETVAAVQEAGGEARFQGVDVTSREQVRTFVGMAVEAYGGLDIAVSCAGIIHNNPFVEIDDETWNRVMNVNLKGTFLLDQETARVMVDRKVGGSIINISSINSLLAPAGLAAYNATKGAVMQLTKTMAVELARDNIRVNAVGPGSVMTDMLKSAILTNPEAMPRLKDRTPLGRPAEPVEIANTVLFLASDEASYFTGQTLYPDGGRSFLSYSMPRED